jgi:hypothetical protein
MRALNSSDAVQQMWGQSGISRKRILINLLTLL